MHRSKSPDFGRTTGPRSEPCTSARGERVRRPVHTKSVCDLTASAAIRACADRITQPRRRLRLPARGVGHCRERVIIAGGARRPVALQVGYHGGAAGQQAPRCSRTRRMTRVTERSAVLTRNSHSEGADTMSCTTTCVGPDPYSPLLQPWDHVRPLGWSQEPGQPTGCRWWWGRAPARVTGSSAMHLEPGCARSPLPTSCLPPSLYVRTPLLSTAAVQYTTNRHSGARGPMAPSGGRHRAPGARPPQRIPPRSLDLPSKLAPQPWRRR